MSLKLKANAAGIIRSFLVPSLILFVIPVFSLWFFPYATRTYDERISNHLIRKIQQDTQLSIETKEEYAAFIRNNPTSKDLQKSDQSYLPDHIRFDYATFQWMYRLAFAALLIALAVFVIPAISWLFSQQSQTALYQSLRIGWLALRVLLSIEIIAQAILVLVLSYWVTALGKNEVYVNLIAIAAVSSIITVIVIVLGLFQSVKPQINLNGSVLKNDNSQPLWLELSRISSNLNTAAPDQVVAGIDDNFFVTESPVTVNGVSYSGRTLFMSLPLLRNLNGSEAEAVVTHELAHFSGDDTYYARHIAPLLARQDACLNQLDWFITRPAFYCVLMFRALFQLSLGEMSRQREFRADWIAAQKTTRGDMAGALVRTTLYSIYRKSVEMQAWYSKSNDSGTRIFEKIQDGLAAFMDKASVRQDLSKLTSSHPFDTHPTMRERWESMGMYLSPQAIKELIQKAPDGEWYAKIPQAAEMERRMESDFEGQFQEQRGQSLAFRYLPSTPEEREVVEKAFPELSVPTDKSGPIMFDFEKIRFGEWSKPVFYHEILSVGSWNDFGKPQLRFYLNREGGEFCCLPLGKKISEREVLIKTIERYQGRYVAAKDYQAKMSQPTDAADKSPPE